jgi:hypothetical protein
VVPAGPSTCTITGSSSRVTAVIAWLAISLSSTNFIMPNAGGRRTGFRASTVLGRKKEKPRRRGVRSTDRIDDQLLEAVEELRQLQSPSASTSLFRRWILLVGIRGARFRRIRSACFGRGRTARTCRGDVALNARALSRRCGWCSGSNTSSCAVARRGRCRPWAWGLSQGNSRACR